MDCTAWDVFVELSANVNEETNVISGYINFCEELCIPVKQISTFQTISGDSDMKNLLC